MAYKIPSGYQYYDASATKTYTAGQTFSGTPGSGDIFEGVSSSLKGILYYYESAQATRPVVSYSSASDISISAGWHLQFHNHTGSATSYTILNSIAGKNVVYVSSSSASKITTLTISSGSGLQYIRLSETSPKITQLKGTMPSTL